MTTITGSKSFTMVLTAEVIPASLWDHMVVEYVKNGIPLGWNIEAFQVLQYTSPLGFLAVVRQYFGQSELVIGFHLRTAVGASTLHVRLPEHACDQCMTFRDIQRQDEFTVARAVEQSGGWALAKGSPGRLHWMFRGSDVTLCKFQAFTWKHRNVPDEMAAYLKWRRCQTCQERLELRSTHA